MTGGYVIFYAFYAVLFIGLIPSVTLCVFIYLTYRNMKQLRNRIQPTAQNTNDSIKRRDRDLLVLVMAEALLYIITASPLVLVFFERMITQFALPNKSLQLIQSEIFALSAAFLLIFVFSAIPFCTYMISSASFRRDFKQLIMSGYQKIRGPAPVQNVSATAQTITQRDTRI